MDHKEESDFTKELEKYQKQIDVGGIYFHYKDTKRERPYIVHTLGIIEATEELCVVYQAQYGEKLVWVRTVDAFLDSIETSEGLIPRFSK